MRGLWNAIAILALANLMAIGGVALWLVSSGRLDKDRMVRLREVLGPTIASERAAAARQAAEAEAQTVADRQAERESRAPLSAAEQLHVRLDLSEVDHQRIERLRQETRDLTVTVARDQDRLAEERRQFEAERRAFESMRQQMAGVEGAAQFRKAVATLQGLTPADAVAILTEVLRMAPGESGSVPVGIGDSVEFGAGGIDQVVAYLNAMQDRSRNKVMAEITRTNPGLAADLLERLRTRGLTTADRRTSTP